jgi:hypothetical protein
MNSVQGERVGRLNRVRFTALTGENERSQRRGSRSTTSAGRMAVALVDWGIDPAWERIQGRRCFQAPASTSSTCLGGTGGIGSASDGAGLARKTEGVPEHQPLEPWVMWAGPAPPLEERSADLDLAPLVGWQ